MKKKKNKVVKRGPATPRPPLNQRPLVQGASAWEEAEKVVGDAAAAAFIASAKKNKAPAPAPAPKPHPRNTSFWVANRDSTRDNSIPFWTTSGYSDGVIGGCMLLLSHPDTGIVYRILGTSMATRSSGIITQGLPYPFSEDSPHDTQPNAPQTKLVFGTKGLVEDPPLKDKDLGPKQTGLRRYLSAEEKDKDNMPFFRIFPNTFDENHLERLDIMVREEPCAQLDTYICRYVKVEPDGSEVETIYDWGAAELPKFLLPEEKVEGNQSWMLKSFRDWAGEDFSNSIDGVKERYGDVPLAFFAGVPQDEANVSGLEEQTLAALDATVEALA